MEEYQSQEGGDMKFSQILGVLLTTANAWALSPITVQKSVLVHEDAEGKQQKTERLILADIQGLSLYTFKPDQPNESTCYDSCAKTWPPVLVNADEAKALSGSLNSAPRKDGSLQLTVDGHPVYLFAGDEKAGDINGDRLGNVWFLIDLKLTK